MATTDTFDHTGSAQTFTVPDDVLAVYLELIGAGTTQPGGLVEGGLDVTPGNDLNLYVGGTNSGQSGGWPGGGSGAFADESSATAESEGGAGYTAARQGGDTFSDTVALAGGAGGDGDDEAFDGLDSSEGGGDGGQGGADTGEDGGSGNGGGGGDQSSGGSGGSGDDTGSSGSQPGGGNGGDQTDFTIDNGESAAAAGGGGGAGWHGGGGGGASAATSNGFASANGGGGAGGANYDDGLDDPAVNSRGAGNTGDGQIAVTYLAAPTDLDAAAQSETEVDLSWTDAPTAEDDYEIHRSTSSGFTPSAGSLVATITAGSTSYSDTGLDAGTTYYYRVVAVTTDGMATQSDTEGSATTDSLIAPTGLTETAHDADSVDVSWTDNSSAEDGYRLYESTDGGNSFTQNGSDLPADTTSATFSGLRNGEEYTLEVRAFDADEEAASNQITVTTDLPDVSLPALSTPTEDEMDVDWTDVINYGDYRLEIRETGRIESIGFLEEGSAGASDVGPRTSYPLGEEWGSGETEDDVEALQFNTDT